MKATFILKDLTESFYDKLSGMEEKEKFRFLARYSHIINGVTCKIGNGTFRDRVDFNILFRKPCRIESKIEPRKGYKLCTFILE